MIVITEATPNPRTRKFLCGVTLSNEPVPISRNDAGTVPLAAALFEHPEVEGMLLNGEAVSVTLSDEILWEGLAGHVRDAIIRTAELSLGRTGQQPAAVEDYARADSEVVGTIKELLETRIRPAVAGDGGDIVFRYYRDGVLGLEMRGACSGCPSSSATLQHGIQRLLSYFVPQVREVVAV